MRTRTKSNITSALPALSAVSVPFTVYPCSGSNVASSLVLSRPYIPLVYDEEVITDETGKGTAHPVRHRKTHFSLNRDLSALTRPNGFPVGKVVFGSGNYIYDTMSYYNGYQAPLAALDQSLGVRGVTMPAGWVVANDGLDYVKVMNDLHDKARQQIADWVLNAIESPSLFIPLLRAAQRLRQIRLNWSGIQQLYANARAAVARIRSLRSRERTKRVAMLVASNHLSWKFGWSPFLQDLENTINGLDSYRNAVSRFLNKKRSRYGKEFNPSVFVPSDATTTDLSLNSYPVYTHTIKCKSLGFVRRYVLVVEPSDRGLWDLLNPSFAALLTSFASGPATLAWEYTPFSFVADWFIDVRGLLRTIDDRLSGLPYKVVSSTFSEKAAVKMTFHSRMVSPCDGGEIQDGQSGFIEHKLYARDVINKTGFVNLSRRLHSNQIRLLASLIATQLRGVSSRNIQSPTTR